MLSRLAKLAFVVTSFTPVLLTFGFISYLRGHYWLDGTLLYVIVSAVLVLACLAILWLCRRHLESVPFAVKSIKATGKEIASFIIAYLLPLLGVAFSNTDWRVVTFMLLMLMGIVWGTCSYHFNPLLGMLGFRFYEATTEDGVTYVLVSRKSLPRAKKIKHVVQVTEYMALDVEE